MKKFAIATMIVLAAGVANAQEATSNLEVGLELTRADDRDNYGVSATKHFDAVSVTAGVATTRDQADDQQRLSLGLGYDVYTMGPVTLTAKAGAGYLFNEVARDGWVGTVGVGASMPIAANLTATVDYARQYGQDRVSQFDGDRVTIGVRYGF